jgi:hypothetical protein
MAETVRLARRARERTDYQAPTRFDWEVYEVCITYSESTNVGCQIWFRLSEGDLSLGRRMELVRFVQYRPARRSCVLASVI